MDTIGRMFDDIASWFWNVIEIISNNLVGIIFGLIVFAIFVLLHKKASRGIGKILEKLFHSNPEIGAGVRAAIIEPLSVFLLFLGLYLAFLIAGLPASVMSGLTRLIRIGIIVLITWALINFTPVATSLIMNFSDKSNKKANAAALKLIANVFKVIIVAISVVIIISELGYDISGLIAGLGLGGLSLSLAAKNTASNFFGGFSIVSDKLFDVGDYISTPSVEGVVEDITMRSTKVRTVADTLMVLPNSKLVDEPITNWSKMNKRYVDIKIGLTYDTPVETMKKCASEIEDMLRKDEDVDNGRIVVSFDEFSDSSLDIRIIYFTKTTVFDEYLKVNEKINYKIREIVEQNGAAFAFPSTSVYMSK